MYNLDVTILEGSQVFGDNRLDIFDKYGTRAAITDFAILLGGIVASNTYTNDGNELKDRTGWYFLKANYKSYYSNNKVFSSNHCGILNWSYIFTREIGVRPALPYFSILPVSSNEVVSKLGNIEVECGEYPQTIVNVSLSNKLESLFIFDKLKETGKSYTTDSVVSSKLYKPFQKRKHIEYEYEGEKYIRIVGDFNSKGKVLSDGRIVKLGTPYFVKVEPIVWMVDKERDIATTKKLLFAGVHFNNKSYNGDFNETDLHYYLNIYFFKDIVPSKVQNTKLYLVNFSGKEEKYFPVYEKEGILRELYTSIELVPEDANFIKEDSLMYHSLKLVEPMEYYSYIENRIDKDSEKYLDYLYELCVLGGKEDMYLLYEEEIVNGSEMEL